MANDDRWTREVELDDHKAVGPYPAYGHGGLTLVNEYDGDGDVETTFALCLDCGYTAADIRHFAHQECDRGRNTINQTWRERVDSEGFPDGD